MYSLFSSWQQGCWRGKCVVRGVFLPFSNRASWSSFEVNELGKVNWLKLDRKQLWNSLQISFVKKMPWHCHIVVFLRPINHVHNYGHTLYHFARAPWEHWSEWNLSSTLLLGTCYKCSMFRVIYWKQVLWQSKVLLASFNCIKASNMLKWTCQRGRIFIHC